MYCSLRLYVDKTSDSVAPENILRLFELFSETLGWTYDHIIYTLFDPEKDCALIDEKYSYDSVGKNNFLNAAILFSVTSQYGTVSAPFITATCRGRATQLYSGHRVQIQFPITSELFIIRVDYAEKNTKKLTLETYNYLLQSLSKIGFCVNNGFFHVYKKKNESITLDGGQIGSWLGCCGYINLNNYLMHYKKGFRNRLMGIYCVNSIRVDSLSKNMIDSITNIVGNNNVKLMDSFFSFSIENIEKITPLYRIKYAIRMNKLHEVLKTNQRTAKGSNK